MRLIWSGSDGLPLEDHLLQVFVFQALRRWGTGRHSLSLSLDFLELVIWNRKEVIGMNGFGLYFSGGTLTVLYVSSSQSVGCQHNFPRLKVYLVVILLKSRQKGALALGADAWGSCIKKIRGF